MELIKIDYIVENLESYLRIKFFLEHKEWPKSFYFKHKNNLFNSRPKFGELVIFESTHNLDKGNHLMMITNISYDTGRWIDRVTLLPDTFDGLVDVKLFKAVEVYGETYNNEYLKIK